MTILNTCVKCRKLFIQLQTNGPPGRRAKAVPRSSTALRCHGPPAAEPCMRRSCTWSPQQENMHPGAKIKQPIDLEVDGSTASCTDYIPWVALSFIPEWPHRQGGCVACCGCTFDSAEVHWFILCTRRSGGTAHEGGGATSQLELPSLTPLSVAGCGWLQLGVTQWAASVITESSW